MQLTLPLTCGMPNVVSLTPPSSAASAKLYPEIASVDDLSRCMRVTHRSMKIVICDGSATAILRRHHAADNRAAGDGCIRTETTGSTIPIHKIHHSPSVTTNCKMLLYATDQDWWQNINCQWSNAYLKSSVSQFPLWVTSSICSGRKPLWIIGAAF